MKPRLLGLITSLGLVLGTGSARAEREVTLFQCKPKVLAVAGYFHLLEKALPGDWLVFCGHRFQIQEKLKHGNSARIYRIVGEEGKVLRVPLSEHDGRFLKQSVLLSQELNKIGVPHAEVLGFEPGQFVWNRDGGALFPYDEWLKKPHSQFSDEYLAEKFKSFSIQSAKAQTIRDFGAQNFAFSPARDEWIVVDALSGTMEAKRSTYLSKNSFLPNLHPLAEVMDEGKRIYPALPVERVKFFQELEGSTGARVNEYRKRHAPSCLQSVFSALGLR